MRIVSGRFGGRRLKAPRGRHTRPTGERVREALFSMLGGQTFERVADVFAGTGGLGLEALSRGAVHVDFYEKDRAARTALTDNIAALGVTETAKVITTPVPRGIGAGPRYDLVLVDPPWGQNLAPLVVGKLVEMDRLTLGAILVIEEQRGKHPPLSDWTALGLSLDDERHYGDTALQFLSLQAI